VVAVIAVLLSGDALAGRVRCSGQAQPVVAVIAVLPSRRVLGGVRRGQAQPVVAVIAVLPSRRVLGGVRRGQAQPVVAVIAVLPSPDVRMRLTDGCVVL
jgi:hypothetical protein